MRGNMIWFFLLPAETRNSKSSIQLTPGDLLKDKSRVDRIIVQSNLANC